LKMSENASFFGLTKSQVPSLYPFFKNELNKGMPRLVGYQQQDVCLWYFYFSWIGILSPKFPIVALLSTCNRKIFISVMLATPKHFQVKH